MIAHDADLVAEYRAKGWWGDVTLDDRVRTAVAAHPQRLALVVPIALAMAESLNPAVLRLRVLTCYPPCAGKQAAQPPVTSHFLLHLSYLLPILFSSTLCTSFVKAAKYLSIDKGMTKFSGSFSKQESILCVPSLD